MKKYLIIAAGLSALIVPQLEAQTSCPTSVPTAATAAENAKQQAADLFQYMAPQIATAIAGGSPPNTPIAASIPAPGMACDPVGSVAEYFPE